MATHLEEQEQLDHLKHLWQRHGTLVSCTALLVVGIFLAWNGWQLKQHNNSVQAAILYGEIERSAQSGDREQTLHALNEMKMRFGNTASAQSSGLLVAKSFYEKADFEGSREALSWVAQNAVDPGYRAVATLRLAAELIDGKLYDEALHVLDSHVARQFEPLIADRKGDVYMAQGKRTQAQAEYRKAWSGLDKQLDYRRLVEVKLNAAGATPQS